MDIKLGTAVSSKLSQHTSIGPHLHQGPEPEFSGNIISVPYMSTIEELSSVFRTRRDTQTPTVSGSQIVAVLQSMVSKNRNHQESALVSVTMIPFNVLSPRVRLVDTIHVELEENDTSMENRIRVLSTRIENSIDSLLKAKSLSPFGCVY